MNEIDCRDFTCMVCIEHRWRTMKPRKGWICPYRKNKTYCPSLEHVYYREQDEELSWTQMEKNLEKNMEINKQRQAREALGEKTVHKMRLYARLFYAVVEGSKTVEVRLDDYKRLWVREGDLIEFSRVDDENETVTVEVTKKMVYVDFEELVENYDARSLGFEGYTIENICNYLRGLFETRKLKACHAVAIEFKLCGDNEGRRI